MEAEPPSGDLTPRVVTGIVPSTILPSVLPAAHLLRREGFTDLSRFALQDRSRTGQCYLPDKEFRYLRTVHDCYPSQRPLRVARPFAFRLALHVAMEIGPYHPPLSRWSGVWPLRIPRIESTRPTAFPADCPHRTVFHCRQFRRRVPTDTRVSQHTAGFVHETTVVHFHSYGRRLPGLRFIASPCG